MNIRRVLGNYVHRILSDPLTLELHMPSADGLLLPVNSSWCYLNIHLSECILSSNVTEDIERLFSHFAYFAFAEVNMSSKVSKETLFESVHAVLQVMKCLSFLLRPAVAFF